MKKAKRYNEGGMSLEEKYPGAKITRLEPQSKPADLPPAKSAYVEMMRQADAEALKKSLEKAAMPEYERKAEKFAKSGGGGGAMSKSNRDLTRNYKSGGSVSSASKRADGCAIRGKTKGKMV